MPALPRLDCVACNDRISAAERWRTREALDGHLRSPLYGRLLEAMECSCKAPEVEFYEATDVGGLELVEKARTTKKP